MAEISHASNAAISPPALTVWCMTNLRASRGALRSFRQNLAEVKSFLQENHTDYARYT